MKREFSAIKIAMRIIFISSGNNHSVWPYWNYKYLMHFIGDLCGFYTWKDYNKIDISMSEDIFKMKRLQGI